MKRCGQCSVCCKILAVKELDKKALEPCIYAKKASLPCQIYPSRPSSCQQFNCYWLYGELPNKARPDKSGVLLQKFTLKALDMPFMMVHEVWKGAAKRSDIVSSFSTYLPVVVISDDGSAEIICHNKLFIPHLQKMAEHLKQ